MQEVQSETDWGLLGGGRGECRQPQKAVCRITLETKNSKRMKAEPRIKYWKLKKEDCCVEFREEVIQKLSGGEGLPDGWVTTCKSGEGDSLEGTRCIIWTEEGRQGDLAVE